MATDSDHALTGDDTSDAEASETMVESLVSGREKRSTAGRNMSSLLDAAADDDLTLLFAEDEHDDEFDEDEGADAEQPEEMSSSEDEDDQGPNAADDDFEGEKELEKQAKADRKKRKAQESLRLTALRKKIKVDPTVASSVPTAAAAARPKKKSERISWLPTLEEGPVRSSSRRQTMQNKEMTHARLKDSEQRRIKLIETMEKAAKKKERTKPKVRTQAERLAEAEKIERMNSKSLNRWEEMEKRKAEERKARLEALQNRRLEGPVMSWWSGVAKWVNGKLVRVGNVEVKPKPDKEEIERKKKLKEKDLKDSTSQDTSKPETSGTPTEGQGPSNQPQPTGAENQQTSGGGSTAQTKENEKSTAGNGFLDGIHQYASLPASPAPETKHDAPNATAPKPEESNVTKPTGDDSGQLEESNDQAKEKATVSAEKTSPKPDEMTPGTEEELEVKPQEKVSEEQTSPEDVSPRPEEAPNNAPTSEETQDKEMEDAPALQLTAADIALDENKSKQQSQDTPLSVSDTPAENAPEESKATSETGPVEPAKPAELVEPAEAAVPATETAQPGTESTTLTASEAQPAIAPPENAAAGFEMDVDPVLAIDLPLSEPSAPLEPQVVEQTGRNLMVLENFDNATTQSRQYSIYFNSKKPPRLASESLSLSLSLPFSILTSQKFPPTFAPSRRNHRDIVILRPNFHSQALLPIKKYAT